MTWVRRLHAKACLAEPKTLPQLVSRLLEPGVAAGAEVDKRMIRAVANLPWGHQEDRNEALAPLLWAHVATHGQQRRPWMRDAGLLLVTHVLGALVLEAAETRVYARPYGEQLRTAELSVSLVRRKMREAPLDIYAKTHAAAEALVAKLDSAFRGDSALKMAGRFLQAAVSESPSDVLDFVPFAAAHALLVAYYRDGRVSDAMLEGGR